MLFSANTALEQESIAAAITTALPMQYCIYTFRMHTNTALSTEAEQRLL